MSFLRSIITAWRATYQVHVTDAQLQELERALDRFDRGRLAQCRPIVVAAQALRLAMLRRDDGYHAPAAKVQALSQAFATLPAAALRHEEQALEREQAGRIAGLEAAQAILSAYAAEVNANEEAVRAVPKSDGYGHFAANILARANIKLGDAIQELRGELPGTTYVNSHSDDVRCVGCGKSHAPLNDAGRCLGCALKENPL